MDIYDPNFIPVESGTGTIENFITILNQPLNITVNQSQTATFSVNAKVTVPNVVTYAVTVDNKSVNHPYYNDGSSKGYYLQGGQFSSNTEAPQLSFIRGATYRFNQNEATNSTHAIYFTETETEFGGTGRYETGVVYKLNNTIVANYSEYVAGFNAATQRSVEIVVPANAPATLYYVCANHSKMGNSIAVNDGSLAYQWQKKDYGTNTWTNVPGATDSTYTTAPATQGDDRDEFRCGITSHGSKRFLQSSHESSISNR